jgi:hypothetical protein
MKPTHYEVEKNEGRAGGWLLVAVDATVGLREGQDLAAATRGIFRTRREATAAYEARAEQALEAGQDIAPLQ